MASEILSKAIGHLAPALPIRVTQVLSFFQNMWKIPQDVLDRKAQIGTELHEAIFRYFFTQDAMLDVGREWFPYLESFHEWAKERKLSVKFFEERIINEELGLSGKPDAILEIDGVSYLFDWKTSAKDDPVCWRLQGTAYIHLLRLAGHTLSDTFYFLKLRKDGKRADTFAYKYTMEGWETFLKAMECAKYFQKWKGALPDAE